MSVSVPGSVREISTVSGAIFVLGIVLGLLIVTGTISLSYAVYLLALVGMYVLLALGLNVQWGYGGMINFAVVAFWGIGAYTTALATARTSPLGLGVSPLVALLAAIVFGVVAAVVVALPAIRLRADYLAIATLGFSEIFRLIVTNERDFTAGMAGLAGIPGVLEGLPLTDVATMLMLVSFGGVVVYVFLRRIHRSPWGRVMRLIRADEDLAKSLGKNTFVFKVQAFVIGCVIMTVAGVYYAHFIGYVDPTDLEPLSTFFVWVAVILGGSGSNRGAVVGAFILVGVLEGTRFITDVGPLAVLNAGSVRLLAVGLLIILIMRFKQEGLYPPQKELIWPKGFDAVEDRE